MTKLTKFVLIITLLIVQKNVWADANYVRALKRAQYLLNSTIPSDSDFTSGASSQTAYKSAVRSFIEDEEFYNVMMRYHEKLFGVGLPVEYLDELMRDDIDHRENKFAQIECGNRKDGQLTCYWSSSNEGSKISSCPASWEEAVSVFWYPGLVAWVCPSVQRTCGNDLSRCFIEFQDERTARNSELGSTEAFDSRYSVVKSLSKQPAGLASAVVIANYPYTKILESGLTAVDGAIAHFYRQKHHFDLDKLHIPSEVLQTVESISLTNTRFQLVNTGESYEQAGVLSTFGWLRRYEKNRTRANQTYERLLCRTFISELPKVFPQDPGNLRTAVGCSGCHGTLDPLADFFLSWGEGGELYNAGQESVNTSFSNQSGMYLSDLAKIISEDNAFATCTTENVWKWLMGREFYTVEDELRTALTNYFIQLNFSFKELVYAIATHPAFIEGNRSDALVGDPLADPPLGDAPGTAELPECDTVIDYNSDIASDISKNCGTCHNATGGSRQDLTTEEQLRSWASQSVSMLTSGNMPPGQPGPPLIGPIYNLKEKIRCWQEQQL